MQVKITWPGGQFKLFPEEDVQFWARMEWEEAGTDLGHPPEKWPACPSDIADCIDFLHEIGFFTIPR